MRAEAILETQKKAYNEAVTSIDEHTALVAEGEKKLVEVKKNSNELIKEANEELKIAYLNDDQYNINRYEKQKAEAEANIIKQEEQVEQQKGIVRGKLDEIALYEDNAAAYAEGRFEDVKTKQEEAIAEDTQGQLEAYQSRYDNLKVQRDAYLANGDEKRAEQVQKEMDEELLNAQTMLETKGINNEAELASLGIFIGDKQARLTEMYAIDEVQWTEEQRKEAEALKTSIDGGLATYNQFATDKVTKAVELRTSLNENSTEEQRNAAAAAEKEAATTLQIAGQNAVDKLNILQDLKARKASGEAGITDNMIMEAERQAVEAEAGYGNVASKISESWEDLPDESKTTFQNVMQPMVDEMQNKEPTLFDKASGIAGGILERLRKSFDINSPSRKVRRIFQEVMEGAELGLDDKTSGLLEQTEAITDQVMNAFSDVNQEDLHGLARKMQMAVDAENVHMKGIVNSNFTQEMYSTNRMKIDMPEIKGTIYGNIENHLEIDGRETAIQLTPFISEEMAFHSR